MDTHWKSLKNFIELCRIENREERLKRLFGLFNLKKDSYDSSNNDLNNINYILDFLIWFDSEYRFLEYLFKDVYKSDIDLSFFEDTLYFDIFRDMQSILLLYLNECTIQVNVILRKTIEYAIYSICFDILSRFGKSKFNFFEIYWYSTELKERIWSKYRISESDIEHKLTELYKLNKLSQEGKHNFRRRFFKYGNEADFFLLFSKPVCKECLQNRHTHINEYLEIESVNSNDQNELEVAPNFKYALLCEYCGENPAHGLVFHCPTIKAVFIVLKYILSDESINALSRINKIYSIISKYCVHFVRLDPKLEFKIDNVKIDFNTLDGVVYTLRQLSFILCDYLIFLKNRYNCNINEVQYCKVRKNKFTKFSEV